MLYTLAAPVGNIYVFICRLSKPRYRLIATKTFISPSLPDMMELFGTRILVNALISARLGCAIIDETLNIPRDCRGSSNGSALMSLVVILRLSLTVE